MKVCIYCTSGEDFNTFGYEIIEEFKFKYYDVLQILYNVNNKILMIIIIRT